MKNKIKVAVLGSTGYVGMELVKFLHQHKSVEINFLGSDSFQDTYLSNIENTIKYIDLPKLKNNKTFNPILSDYVFLALPHAISNQYVKDFYNQIKIIDLSADFRLNNKDDYIANYGNNHTCLEFLKSFVYGLAEINKKEIFNTNYISVPGCYPTSILLPLIPLIKNNLIKTDNIIIDSKSGYSGAGKKFDLKNIKLNNEFNFYNYNTNSHRHISEIRQELQKYNINKKLSFSFNPHILPNFRGMLSTIYCDINDKINFNHILELFKSFEESNYFIKLLDENERLDLFSVQNTNFCKIKIYNLKEEKKIIIVSCIDNLIKGASGQAIQCFNLMENFEETMGLVL